MLNAAIDGAVDMVTSTDKLVIISVLNLTSNQCLQVVYRYERYILIHN